MKCNHDVRDLSSHSTHAKITHPTVWYIQEILHEANKVEFTPCLLACCPKFQPLYWCIVKFKNLKCVRGIPGALFGENMVLWVNWQAFSWTSHKLYVCLVQALNLALVALFDLINVQMWLSRFYSVFYSNGSHWKSALMSSMSGEINSHQNSSKSDYCGSKH